MSWFITALKKYAVFSGRSRRSEYWYFALFYSIIYIALALIDSASAHPPGLLVHILALALFIPFLAVSVRRLHDTDRSGWWVLIGLIPFGVIALIVFYVQDGGPGRNRFGLNPKEAT